LRAYLKKSFTKLGQVEWLKVKALRSSPSTIKNKKKERKQKKKHEETLPTGTPRSVYGGLTTKRMSALLSPVIAGRSCTPSPWAIVGKQEPQEISSFC
jgi:hypothetical protein